MPYLRVKKTLTPLSQNIERKGFQNFRNLGGSNVGVLRKLAYGAPLTYDSRKIRKFFQKIVPNKQTEQFFLGCAP